MNRILQSLTLILLFSLHSKAQALTEKEILGTWKVVQIFVPENKVKADQKQAMDMLKGAFLKSKFRFGADRKFTFDFALPGMQVNNGRWNYNAATKTFVIKDWNDKSAGAGGLMEIETKKTGSKIVFRLADSPFSMEVMKEK